MNHEQFCYWLQGRAELVEAPPTEAEWEAIREHLSLTFKKLTPPVMFGGGMIAPRGGGIAQAIPCADIGAVAQC